MNTLNFRSDNEAPVAPQIMAALEQANTGTARAYGADRWSAALGKQFNELFEKEVAVYPVTTGTAANSLGLSPFTPPYGAILCHEGAHIHNSECGGPEFYTGGAKLFPLSGASGKISPQILQSQLPKFDPNDQHDVELTTLSLTQATEMGTVYSPSEVGALCDIAKERGLAVHMDGARFANAVAYLGCQPADITWKAGVDVLSFGATKNGCLAAEAIVFFDPERAHSFFRRRKRAGHEWSKMRFLSAQLLACTEQGLWLEFAARANECARQVAASLQATGAVQILAPVEANEIFVECASVFADYLTDHGVEFKSGPADTEGGSLGMRFVASYALSDDDLHRFAVICDRFARSDLSA